MSAPLVECVPNFSEGRDHVVIDSLSRAITGVAGARLIDVQVDAAHHRSVFTFVAPPVAAVEAAFRAAGASLVSLVEEERAEPFGARLRRLAAQAGTPGLVVLGSGAMALARPADFGMHEAGDHRLYQRQA